MRTVSLVAAVAAVFTFLVPTAASYGTSHVPQCRTGSLAASYTDDGGAAAGHSFGHLRLRNISGSTCYVRGYGGLSFVGDGNGTQLGAPAARTPSKMPRVVLQPGQAAASLVEITSPDPYPRSTCRRAHADGFRVYVPNATRSKFVAFPTVTCANPQLVMLQHKAYRRA